MVVAHVLTSLQIGGGERLTLDLAAGQAADGHRVLVVDLAPADGAPGALAAEFRARGVSVERVPKAGGFDPTLSLRLAALFRRRGVQVAHLHNRLPLVYGAPAARLARAVAVHTRHGPRPSSRRMQWLLRGAGHLLHAYVAVSPELADLAVRRGECAPGRIAVIENGIDVDRFDSSPERRAAARVALGVPAEAFVVGSVGRFAPEKDYPLLVRAIAPLLGPEVRLVIVGDGATRPDVEREVAAADVAPWVALPGARQDVATLLSGLDLFVLSSKMEGMPLVVLEAMAAGVPVVATAVGGLPALIRDGETGFLVPPGDEAALRGRLAALRAAPEEARRVGAQARATARTRHAGHRMVRDYLDLYRRLGVRG